MQLTKTTSQCVDEIFAKFRRIVESNCIQELLGIDPIVKFVRHDEFLAKTRLAKIKEIFCTELDYLRIRVNYEELNRVYARFLRVLYQWGVIPSNDTVYAILDYYRDSHLLRCLIYCGFTVDYDAYGIDYDSYRYFQRFFDVGWNKLLIDAGVDEIGLREQISRTDLQFLDARFRNGDDFYVLGRDTPDFGIENTVIFDLLIEM